MKTYIIVKVYDNNASSNQCAFSSKAKAQKWLDRELDSFVECGYTCERYVRLGGGVEHSLYKDGVRKHVFYIDEFEVNNEDF